MEQMADFDTALHLEEQHKAEGEADGYRLALQSYLCEQSLSCCVNSKLSFADNSASTLQSQSL